MNRYLITAGAFAGALTLIHIIGGGIDVHTPLLQTQANTELAAYISILWHGVTASLFVIAASLIFSGVHTRNGAAVAVVAISLCIAFAGLFLVYGLSRLGTIWLMPQWIAFLAIATVSLIGLIKQGQYDA